MQIPKLTPIVIGIFVATVCLLSVAIYYFIRKKDEENNNMTYVYSIIPAIVIAVVVIFVYDNYIGCSKNDLLQESFYS